MAAERAAQAAIGACCVETCRIPTLAGSRTRHSQPVAAEPIQSLRLVGERARWQRAWPTKLGNTVAHAVRVQQTNVEGLSSRVNGLDMEMIPRRKLCDAIA